MSNSNVIFMKSALYRRAGPPEVLEYLSVPRPAPRDEELLIKVEAISVEGGELASRRLREPDTDMQVPGGAAAGTVVAVGSKVTGFDVGDAVTSFSFGGSYAEYRAVSSSTCWKIPVGLDMAAAATIPVAFGTASLALSLGNLKAGETVLVQGVTGAVGIAAVQLARTIGARVLGTGLESEKLERLESYGLSRGLILKSADEIEGQLQALGEGTIDLLVDMVGGRSLQCGMQVLRDGGRAVVIGINTRESNTLDAAALLVRCHSVHGCFLGPIIGEPDSYAAITKCLEKVSKQELSVPIAATFRLSEAAQAHTYAEAAQCFGRVVMVP